MKIELHHRDPAINANPRVRKWLNNVALELEKRIQFSDRFDLGVSFLGVDVKKLVDEQEKLNPEILRLWEAANGNV